MNGLYRNLCQISLFFVFKFFISKKRKERREGKIEGRGKHLS